MIFSSPKYVIGLYYVSNIHNLLRKRKEKKEKVAPAFANAFSSSVSLFAVCMPIHTLFENEP